MGDMENLEEREKEELLKNYLLLEVSWLNPEDVSLRDYDLQIFIDNHTVTVVGEECKIRIYSLYYKGLMVLSGFYDEFGNAHILTFVPGEWENYLGICRKMQQKHEEDQTIELIWKK